MNKELEKNQEIDKIQVKSEDQDKSDKQIEENKPVKEDKNDVKQKSEPKAIEDDEKNPEVEAEKKNEKQDPEVEAEKKNDEQDPEVDVEEKGGRKIKKIIWILPALLILALVAGAAYFAKGYSEKVEYFETRYFSNTYINGMNCSEMDAQSVAALLDEKAREYSLQIMGKDEDGNSVQLGIIDSEEINLTLTDALMAAQDILNRQDEKHWYEAQKQCMHSYEVEQDVFFDEELLKSVIEEMNAFQSKNMVKPEDAYIGEFSEEKGGYELIPEVNGTELDMDMVFACITNAVSEGIASVDLVEAGCYMMPAVTSADEKLVTTVDTVNRWLSTEIVYDWNTFEIILDTSVIKEWVSIVDDEPVLDEEAVASFVNRNADQYDTYGKTRRFLTTLGVELSLPSGAFGWKTDREAETVALIELIKQGERTSREPEYSWKAQHRRKYKSYRFSAQYR